MANMVPPQGEEDDGWKTESGLRLQVNVGSAGVILRSPIGGDMKSERQYFGEVDMVQITGNLSHEKSIANVTFSRVTKYNTLEEVTITLTQELAHRLAVHLNDALNGDGEIFVEFS